MRETKNVLISNRIFTSNLLLRENAADVNLGFKKVLHEIVHKFKK
jgi:hypothetical protein